MIFFRKKRDDNQNVIHEIPDSCQYKQQCHVKHRHRHGRSLASWEATSQEEFSLSDCPAGSSCTISYNPNKMTKEIGLNPGKTIAVFKNEPNDSNIIICLDTTRFIVARSIAKKISVKVIAPENKGE